MGMGLISEVKRIPSMRSYAAIFRFKAEFNSAFEELVLETLKRESTARRFPAAINFLLMSVFGVECLSWETNKLLVLFTSFTMFKSEISLLSYFGKSKNSNV